jgi:hypothetical protein
VGLELGWLSWLPACFFAYLFILAKLGLIKIRIALFHFIIKNRLHSPDPYGLPYPILIVSSTGRIPWPGTHPRGTRYEYWDGEVVILEWHRTHQSQSITFNFSKLLDDALVDRPCGECT